VDVVVTLLVIIGVLGLLMFSLLGVPGIIILFIVLAFTTEVYTQDVQEYHALTVLNSFTGIQRVMFQGRTGKLPWERAGTLVDLRSEIKDIPQETWATAAGAMMEAKYIYLLHPMPTPTGIITYAGYTKDTVKAAARNLFSMMLSDHFGLCTDPIQLLKKDTVNKTVFEKDDGTPKDKILKFEIAYGVMSFAKLEDVDFDEATQKARDTITNARSFDEAVDILMAERKDGKPGMARADAEMVAKLANFPNVSENNINVKGLENLRSGTLVGGLGFADGKKGKK
jgi:hypothetical protein